MSSHERNRPGTAEGSTEATVFRTDNSTAREPAKPEKEPLISVNQVYAEEVELFFMGNQAPLTPMEVENALINQINSRFLTINT